MNNPLIEIKDLKKEFYPKRSLFDKNKTVLKAVDGVSLTINENEVVGLVGESGCGKSTLGKTIIQLIKPTSGEVLFEGKSIIGLKGKELKEFRSKVQIIFQDPLSSLNPRMTIEEILREPFEVHKGISKEEQEEKIKYLLHRVGLEEEALTKYPHQFSGGQCQRIAIARALTVEPKLIIADEPVSALDVSVQAQVINLMLDLKDEFGLSYLFISHDLSVVDYISDRVAVMYLGQVVEEGSAEEIINNPKHPYTKALVSVAPKLGSFRKERILLTGGVPSPINMPVGCRFHTRCPIVESKCKEEEPELINGIRCFFS